MSNVYGKESGAVIVIDNGRGRYKLEMHNFDSQDDSISFSICGARGGHKATIRIDKSDLRIALLRAGIVKRATPSEITYIDPMAPDYAALAAHEPTSQIEDSRDAAGLGAGPQLTAIPQHREGDGWSTGSW
jgi:hypothetical protein